MTLADALSVEVEGIKRLSPTTIKLYRHHVNRFAKFCGSEARACPASDRVLADYIELLMADGYKYTFIQQSIAAILAVHRRLGQDDPLGPMAGFARCRALLSRRGIDATDAKIGELSDRQSAPYLKTKEVASLLGVSHPTLRSRMKMTPDHIGKPWIRVGGSDRSPRYRWRADLIDKWRQEINDYIRRGAIVRILSSEYAPGDFRAYRLSRARSI